MSAGETRPAEGTTRDGGSRDEGGGATGREAPRWRRLAWFVGLYVASLAGFTAVVYGLRALVPG